MWALRKTGTNPQKGLPTSREGRLELYGRSAFCLPAMAELGRVRPLRATTLDGHQIVLIRGVAAID